MNPVCPQNLNNLRRNRNEFIKFRVRRDPCQSTSWASIHSKYEFATNWKFGMTVGEKTSALGQELSYRIWNINTRFKITQPSWLFWGLIYVHSLCLQTVFVKFRIMNLILEQIWLTDWFHKLKVTVLNISKTTNNSPFFILNKNV